MIAASVLGKIHHSSASFTAEAVDFASDLPPVHARATAKGGRTADGGRGARFEIVIR